MPKKNLLIAILFVLLGIAVGRYVFPKQGDTKSIQITENSDCDLKGLDNGKLNTKIDLLQEYAVFTALPKEKFADPVNYADSMINAVNSINEDELTVRFNATADPAKSDEQRAAEIVKFLNFLATDIKDDLK
ncbi:MAG TPA: hypothetical protein DCS28_04310 [Candidatus Moranbacteria bacterium]|nr:hypothetical protein [Candidatus Moranbacteria bacterium]HAT75233.1 hypothetical protein [Candidatus Moranbacteria bacterium]